MAARRDTRGPSQAGTAAAASDARRRAQEAEDALASAREELEDLRAALQEQRERADHAEAAAGGERERLQEQLIEVRTEVEAAQTAAASDERWRAEQAESALADAREQLSIIRMELQERYAEANLAGPQLEQAHAELERERAAAAAAASALAAERESAAAVRAELAAAQERLEHVRPAATSVAIPTQGLSGPGTVDSTQAPRWSPDAQRSFTASLAAAPDWRVGLKETIKVIGLQGGWDTVTSWCPDSRGVLRCVAMWISDSDLAQFETVTWQHSERITDGVLGEALTAPGAMTLAELETTEDVRMRQAAAQGMTSVVLVPVRDGTAPVRSWSC